MTKRALAAGGLAAALAGMGAGAAEAKPDLFVVDSGVELEFVSCETAEPLLRGSVLYVNVGDAAARRGIGGALATIMRITVAGFEDVNSAEFNLLSPGERSRIDFELGAGEPKSGRLERNAAGEILVTFEVDPLNRVDESDESNNVATIRLAAACD